MKAIDAVREYIDKNEIISKNDLTQILIQHYPGISCSNINWQIHNLLKRSEIANAGKGIYTASKHRSFIPVLNGKTEKVSGYIKENFPGLAYTIWDTGILNDFTLHQVARYSIILEVERGAENSIFYSLIDEFYDVFLTPNEKEYELYVANKDLPVVIKPLISQSPIMNINASPTPRLEKILVDIFVDTVIFTPFQGNELVLIFQNANRMYTLNFSRLYRYAGRRGVKNKLQLFIELCGIESLTKK